MRFDILTLFPELFTPFLELSGHQTQFSLRFLKPFLSFLSV